MKFTFYKDEDIVLIVESLSLHDATWVAKIKGIVYDDYKMEEGK